MPEQLSEPALETAGQQHGTLNSPEDNGEKEEYVNKSAYASATASVGNHVVSVSSDDSVSSPSWFGRFSSFFSNKLIVH